MMMSNVIRLYFDVYVGNSNRMIWILSLCQIALLIMSIQRDACYNSRALWKTML